MPAMAWDWIEKGAKRLQEIGGEYKQHQALVERLLTLDPVAAQLEMSQLWPAMNDRARAGVKMTLAGLTLSHQAAAASAEATQRAERLKALHAAIEQAARGTVSGAAARGSTEATVTTGAARVTQTLAGVAERARPKAEELIESARKGIEKHGPAVEAAVKGAINELLKVQMPGAAKPAPPSPEPAATAAPQAASAAAPPAEGTQSATTITGHWVGTLRRAGTTDTLGCDLHLAPSGRPIWSYHDSDGFHQTELTHEGQQLQYVPPERGVVTVKVQSVTGSSTQTGYVVDYSFERASNGYMTQRYQRIALNGWLRGGQLQVTYSEDGISSFGDKTGLTAGGNVKEFSGSLIKQA
jgi:hypothetical protein